jgi:membrane protein
MEAAVLPRIRESAARVRDAAATLSPREALAAIVAGFRAHRLTIQASAIAFRAFLALIPLLLFGFGLLGLFGAEEVWRQDIAPDLRGGVSDAAFTLIDDAVVNVLTEKQLFWVTLGALVAVWEVSGIVRANALILDAVYEVREERSARQRFLLSFAVAAAVIPLVLAAVLIVRLGPLALDGLLGTGTPGEVIGFAIRWLLATALLLVAIGLMLRAAPDVKRPWHWVTFGSLVVVSAWILMSLLFGLYLTEIADYGSVFGNLATIFVALEYLYLSAIVFLAGLVLDSEVEDRAQR